MPRKPQIHYSGSRKAYITQVGGKQHTLQPAEADDAPSGPNYLAALEEFRKVLSGRAQPAVGPLSLAHVFQRYLESVRAGGAAATLALRQRHLQDFLDRVKVATATDLRPSHLSDWLASHTTWNSSTRAIAYDAVMICLNWAVEERLLDSNPCRARKRRPKSLSRGAQVLVSPAIHQRLLTRTSRTNPTFALVVRLLWATGARPHELYLARAEHLHLADGCLVVPSALTKRRSTLRQARDSVVFLPDDLLAEVAGLAKRYPDGPLFRTRSGEGWDQNHLSITFTRYRKRLGLPKGSLSAYGYRHTYATDFLRRGGSVAVLAQLLNTSVAMIDRHYGHLEAYRASLRTEAVRCRSAAGG